MTAVLILPGLFGSDEAHWQQFWLRDQPDSICVVQNDFDNPRLSDWMPRLEETLDAVGEAYIVAHSLGCLLAANLAGTAAARQVKAALLVAPCDLQPTHTLHPGKVVFGDMPMGQLPFPAKVVGSLSDRYMSLDCLTLVARCWGAEIKNIGNAGHINTASGFGRWSGGYQLLEGMKSRTRRRRSVAELPMCPVR
ncbi:RBBP9/YdeN family alpha/beta hydrolase [Rhizobium tumorigenes]|uniref:Alpha/beta fold hydrolase n=1 Tax=Rhizobium tumorigenes TaxID=2041385 RepID=A0AAF1K895_9HYPH|nr:alpha/beta hydrolase [Rhizobium tumorigenes]WFR97858.1 alpha/beta fold hydrolase [Rhizobium tumorigenes]WFS03417.1 alpha/beta fold hydrolase [Rhizobium tumorigenes]